jgi:predicted metalloprotease with PDZ domain
MRRILKVRMLGCAIVVSCFVVALPAQQSPPTRYRVSLANKQEHMVRVQISLGPGKAERELQLPVWNALYQVRDFSQFVDHVKATDGEAHALDIVKVEKSRWLVRNAEKGAIIEYDIYCDAQGPYGAQLNEHHAFFNLAEVLMYSVDARNHAVQIEFTDLDPKWTIASPLQICETKFYCANSYDQMVDSPVEVGSFSEKNFEEGGARYRVIVDADQDDYRMSELTGKLRAIVRAGVEWMNDRPYATYMFIYHFPRQPSDGGMEHAYGTAIDVSASLLKSNPEWFDAVSAHEFFHLWNVKRIRPSSLEPVDYTKENYTRALWFSEGLTSTVQGYILLHSGLLSEHRYLALLGEQITNLQTREGHRDQSAEESSLDAWLEKYAYYREPSRSISYYNKGELLGVLLDLKIRNATGGKASLRELFRWMNETYAQKGKFFDDSAAVLQAAETVCQCDMSEFFHRYVAGTEEIPWNVFFSAVGLKVDTKITQTADAGFEMQRMFGGTIQVTQVSVLSGAASSGLTIGDVILTLNERPAVGNPQELVTNLRPGDSVRLVVQRGSAELKMNFKCGAQNNVEYHLSDVPNLSPEQKARRSEWLGVQSRGVKAN